MATISVRDTVTAALNTDGSNLANGVLDTILNPFYKSATGRAHFPYGPGNGVVSLREVFETWKFPSSYGSPTTYPDIETSPNYAANAQGIAASNTDWFISNNKRPASKRTPRVWRYGLGFDLNTHLDLTVEGGNVVTGPESLQDQGYDHFGAPTYHNGYLWVSLDAESAENPCKVLTYQIDPMGSSYMSLVKTQDLTANGAGSNSPWVAINPKDGLLYSSRFDSDPFTLLPYAINGLTLAEVEVLFPLYETWSTTFVGARIQGAAFSPQGHLYVVSDRSTADGGGIYVFEMVHGQQMAYIPVEHPFESDGGNRYELEGICVFDLGNVSHHSSVSGQIHLVMLRNRTPVIWDVAVAINHYQVPAGEESKV